MMLLRSCFVGDSAARNQAEALVCFLSTVSRPETVHQYDDHVGKKFWRWSFPAPHDVVVLTYWSPFLVRAGGRSEDFVLAQDILFLDELNEPWTAEADAMDVMVISAGHWFDRPAIYLDNGLVAGVQNRPDVNRTQMSFLGVYHEVLRRTLEFVNANSTTDKLVVVSTIAPAHFDRRYSWNHRDACSRTALYEEGETQVGSTDAELRKAVLEEVAAAVVRWRRSELRFEVLDVTRLVAMRPDVHPGPHLFRDAYRDWPLPETVANDCLHWCSPGPIDTFNDILAWIVEVKSSVDDYNVPVDRDGRRDQVQGEGEGDIKKKVREESILLLENSVQV
ncbi:xyloglucan O-acetyltransferase 1-like [Phragmites australis]|uniref:xyloglucan O-acetyltransferase 1-like n=1 Tax=Phragmites australis TaxID=29695 RepID=UPI002D76679E|nr:xyloglucan O-acetyltransferase 1-like [Phragmites australis]